MSSIEIAAKSALQTNPLKTGTPNNEERTLNKLATELEDVKSSVRSTKKILESLENRLRQQNIAKRFQTQPLSAFNETEAINIESITRYTREVEAELLTAVALKEIDQVREENEQKLLQKQKEAAEFAANIEKKKQDSKQRYRQLRNLMKSGPDFLVYLMTTLQRTMHVEVFKNEKVFSIGQHGRTELWERVLPETPRESKAKKPKKLPPKKKEILLEEALPKSSHDVALRLSQAMQKLAVEDGQRLSEAIRFSDVCMTDVQKYQLLSFSDIGIKNITCVLPLSTVREVMYLETIKDEDSKKVDNDKPGPNDRDPPPIEATIKREKSTEGIPVLMASKNNQLSIVVGEFNEPMDKLHDELKRRVFQSQPSLDAIKTKHDKLKLSIPSTPLATYESKYLFVGTRDGFGHILVLSELESIAPSAMETKPEEEQQEEQQGVQPSKKLTDEEKAIEQAREEEAKKIDDIVSMVKSQLPKLRQEIHITKRISSGPIHHSCWFQSENVVLTLAISLDTNQEQIAAFTLPALDEAWACPTAEFATIADKKTLKIIDNVKSNIKATSTSIAKSLVTGLVYDEFFQRVYVSLRSGNILQIVRDESTVNKADPFAPTSAAALAVSFVLMVQRDKYHEVNEARPDIEENKYLILTMLPFTHTLENKRCLLISGFDNSIRIFELRVNRTNEVDAAPIFKYAPQEDIDEPWCHPSSEQGTRCVIWEMPTDGQYVLGYRQDGGVLVFAIDDHIPLLETQTLSTKSAISSKSQEEEEVSKALNDTPIEATLTKRIVHTLEPGVSILLGDKDSSIMSLKRFSEYFNGHKSTLIAPKE